MRMARFLAMVSPTPKPHSRPEIQITRKEITFPIPARYVFSSMTQFSILQIWYFLPHAS